MIIITVSETGLDHIRSPRSVKGLLRGQVRQLIQLAAGADAINFGTVVKFDQTAGLGNQVAADGNGVEFRLGDIGQSGEFIIDIAGNGAPSRIGVAVDKKVFVAARHIIDSRPVLGIYFDDSALRRDCYC